MRLRCVRRYSSGFGRYSVGELVDVSDYMGALLQRDSPDSFEPVGPPPSNPEPEVERHETASGALVPDRRYRSGFRRKS